jgi:hypothetical protein
LAVVVAGGVLSAPCLADDLPVSLVPYSVSIAIDFEDAPDFPPAFRKRAQEDVQRLLARTVGERWSLTLAGRDLPSDLAAITPGAVPIPRREPATGATLGFPDNGSPDKYFFVTTRGSGPGYIVSAREWDRLTDTLGPIRAGAAITREDISRGIVSALLAAFRPVALVGRTVDEQSASLEVRAAHIPAPDPAAAKLAPGSLFTVVLRRLDRDGVLTEVRPVPYTYLEVTKADGGATTAALRSALRRPLAGRRGRVEAWAVAAPATTEFTRLTVTRREDGVPLSGRIVEIRPQPATPGKEEAPPERSILTDRSGSVVIPADPKRPLVWLTVRSGDATLMRMPLAPGVEREVALPLGDDQRRIDAESRIAIVTGDLIETVAKRATLLAKARTGARAGRYAEADAALIDAAKLPDAVAFRRRLAAVEAPAAEAAQKGGDRMAAARIRALGRKAAGLVDRYLNPEALRTTHEEVEELKRTDPDLSPPPSVPADAPAVTQPAPPQETAPKPPRQNPAPKPAAPASPTGPRF